MAKKKAPPAKKSAPAKKAAPKTAPAKKAPPAAKAAPAKKAAAPGKDPAKMAPAPGRLQSVTPHLVVRGAAAAISFYRQAFGAQEVMRMPSPDGFGVMHAEIKIGSSLIYLVDEMPMGGSTCKSPQTLGGTTSSVHLYVDDCDKVFKQAVDAGATVVMPPADMFWGDRFAKVRDPLGHEWSIATHKVDVPPAEMEKRMKAAFAKMAKPPA